MNAQACDALVLFGATGDLAGKMLLPAVEALQSRHALEVPVIGVSRRDARGTPAAERVRQDLEQHAELDRAQSAELASRLRYVEGELDDPSTFAELARTLDGAKRPLYYLAVPPTLFAGIAAQLARAGITQGARLAVEKPFGHDSASAHTLEADLERAFDPSSIVRVDHYLAKWSVRAITQWRAANPWLEQAWSGAFVRSVQVTMAEAFGVEHRGRFYDAVGALRDVVQNHVLQVVAVLAMELPERADPASWEDARVAAMSAIQPVSPDAVVRGQYDGYRDIDGVQQDSQTETYVAMRLDIDTPRWRGVPFCVRAGKRLAVTATEVLARFAPPAGTGRASYLRLRLGPGPVHIGAGVGTLDVADPATELTALLGHCGDQGAYVALLDAALHGEPSYAETADGVFAAWRAVEPALRAPQEVHRYAPGTWGPAEADRVLPPGERWHTSSASG